LVSKYDHLNNQLEQYKQKNIYRELLVSQIKKEKDNNGKNSFYLNNKKVINLCSNDYLGLSQNPVILGRTRESLKQVSQCSSRLISGNDINIIKLENLLANHRKTERALVYPTGYMANLGAITAVSSPEHIIFSDSLNHASIIDACRLAKSKKVEIFRHNDIDHLSGLLKKNVESKQKIIVTEGIFSMDGDIAKLGELAELVRKYDAILIVDDAHSDFVFGKFENYAGIPEYYGIEKDVDIHISSLSKGLGCFGGYVATSELVNDYLINRSRQFIYTSAIPEHLCVGAISAISFLNKHTNIQKNFLLLVEWFHKELKKNRFNTGQSSSQIIPLIIGDEKLAITVSKELFKKGIFIQAVRYPTVPIGKARLRISINASIQKSQLKYVIMCLVKIFNKYQLI
jgi:glycine C-acetyltransferase